MSYESRIAEYKAFVEKDAPYEAYIAIYSRSYEEHEGFFVKFASRIKKERSGLVGQVREKMVKTWFVTNHPSLSLVDKKGNSRIIDNFLNNSYAGQVDYLYEDANYIYNGSGKDRSLSKKESMSMNESDVASELFEASVVIDNARKNGKKVKGILSTSSYVDFKKNNAQLKKNFDEYLIICLNDNVLKRYIFNDYYLKQISNGYMEICSLRLLYAMTQDVFSSYNNDFDKMFDVLSGKSKKPFTLYHSQKVLSENVMEKFCNGFREVCLTAPVRSGKTIISAEVIRLFMKGNYKGRIVGFETFFPDTIIGIINDYVTVIGRENINVVIIDGSTMKTIDDLRLSKEKLNIIFFSGQYSVHSDNVKALALEVIKEMEFLIYDEAHLGYGSERQVNFRSYMRQDSYVLAMTATPSNVSVGNMARVEFTYIDMIQSVINGYTNYAKHPVRVYVGSDVTCEDGKTVKINKVSEIASNKDDVVAYFMSLMMACKNGINICNRKKALRAINGITGVAEYLLKTKDIYNPRNFICVCNNIKECLEIVRFLNEAVKEGKLTNLITEFSTSEGNSDGIVNPNVVDAMNAFFKTRDENFRIFFLVKQGLVGTTINNLEGVIMFNDTQSHTFYEQATGRCALPVCINGEDILFTFVFDPLRNRVVKMNDEMIRYNTKKNVVEHSNPITKFCRATMMSLCFQEVVDIDMNRFEEIYYKDQLAESMNVKSILSKGYPHFIPSSGNIVELSEDDERVNFEYLNQVFKYSGSNKRAVNKYVSNGIYEKTLVPRKSPESKEEEEEQKKNFFSAAFINMLFGLFIMRCVFAIFSLSDEEREYIGNVDNSSAEKLFDRLNSIFDVQFRDGTLFDYLFEYPTFNKDYFKSFNDFVSFFCNEDESKRFFDINTLREEVCKVIKTVTHYDRTEIQNIIMASNAVAEFGEVFTPIPFIEEVMIPRMIEYFGEEWFSKKTLKIADIACGSGNFLVALKPVLMKYQRKHFSSDEECELHIVKNIFYGNEIQGANAAQTQKRVDPKNLVPNNPHITCCDTLSKDFDFWGDTHFDLIIGNPPYQKSKEGRDDNGSKNIYFDFVYLAKKHSDVMIQIIMGKWMIDEAKTAKTFREKIFNSSLAEFHDYYNSRSVFPNFKSLPGGCCWFIYDKHYDGETKCFTHVLNKVIERTINMNTTDFVRFHLMESMYSKIQEKCSVSLMDSISSMDPFLLKRNNKKFDDVSEAKTDDYNIPFIYVKNKNSKRMLCYVKEGIANNNHEYVDVKKVYFNSTSNAVYKETDNAVCTMCEIADAGMLVSDTFIIVLKTFSDDKHLENLKNYINGKFARFFLAMGKPSIHNTKRCWKYVPDMLDYSIEWSDEKLYEYFELSNEEIEAIETFVKARD